MAGLFVGGVLGRFKKAVKGLEYFLSEDKCIGNQIPHPKKFTLVKCDTKVQLLHRLSLRYFG